MTLTQDQVFEALKQVIDPELHIDIVSLGLVYGAEIVSPEARADGISDRPFINIRLTLTTPGCPLAGTFDTMVRDALSSLPGVDTRSDISIELTFDPPWVPDMMTEEAKAELGF